ncbi:MAG: AbrB/MazE/SpoVT family DNA-binding domain-containing protein [Nanoarchaeota archaeon]
MERQLVKHGASTLMVSLPKKWLDQQKLQKGDSIEITTSVDKLILNSKKYKKKNLPINIYFRKADYGSVWTTLGTLYRKGCDEVYIKFEETDCFYHIQQVVKLLPGLEIMEQTGKSCVIKNIAKELTLDFETVFNKIVNIIKFEFMFIRENLTMGNKEKKQECRNLRDECWKFKNLVYVYFKENLFISTFDNYFCIHIIEQNATYLYWLYQSFDRSGLDKVSPAFIRLYDKIFKYFVESISKIKTKDEEYINYIMNTRRELLKECEEYALKKTKDRFLVIYLSMLVQNIHNPKTLIV